MKEIYSFLNRTKIGSALLLRSAIMLSLILSGCEFLQNGLRASATETPFPTLFVPTPDCGAPTLVLGSTTFEIETLTPGADGSITVPSDTSGIAYWVEGTDTHPVFLLSPLPENVAAMSMLTDGSTAKVTWSNCNSTTYHLLAPREGTFDGSALPDQSAQGITVVFETDASGAGIIFNGDLTEEQISTFDTPIPGTADIQAEVSLLETTPSEDGTTLKIGLSILNYGTSAFTISASDVSLTEPDGTALTMASSEPALPIEITPGTTETISLTFPRPTAPTVTFKVLTVEYDIEGY